MTRDLRSNDPYFLGPLSDLLERLPSRPRRPEPDGMPPVTNNGYRHGFFRGWDVQLQYNEYWYFAFHDNDSGLTGMITYGVVNPDGALLGRSLVSAALFEPGSPIPYSVLDLYSAAKFRSSEAKADLTIGDHNSAVSQRSEDGDPEVYHIRGRSKDGSLTLALRFEAVGAPQLAGQHLPGPLHWEWDSWILALPGAKVSGSVKLHGASYEITRGGGYHDHSWGTWFLPARIWAWATASDPDQQVHIVVGYKCGFEVSTCYLDIKGRRHFFDSRFHTTMNWQADPKSWNTIGTNTRHPFPTVVTMSVENEEVKVSIQWRVTASVLLDHSPIAIFEQAALIDIELIDKQSSEKLSYTNLRGHSQFVTRLFDPTQPGTSLGVD